MDEKYGSRFPERGLCLVLRACTPYEFPSLSPSLPPPFVQRYNTEVLLCISTNVACVQPPAFLKKKSENRPLLRFFFLQESGRPYAGYTNAMSSVALKLTWMCLCGIFNSRRGLKTLSNGLQTGFKQSVPGDSADYASGPCFSRYNTAGIAEFDFVK